MYNMLRGNRVDTERQAEYVYIPIEVKENEYEERQLVS